MTMRDFQMPCGCKRITHRNDKGEVKWIDEAICDKHMRPMWDAMPVLSRRFPTTPEQVDEEADDDAE